MSAKALIFYGGWEGHEPEACAAIVEEMLQAEGFDVRSEAGVAVLGEADLARFDLIVPMCTQVSIDQASLERLCTAIEAGTGLAGFHGGMGDTFRDAPTYQFMAGGQWVATPQGPAWLLQQPPAMGQAGPQGGQDTQNAPKMCPKGANWSQRRAERLPRGIRKSP